MWLKTTHLLSVDSWGPGGLGTGHSTLGPVLSVPQTASARLHSFLELGVLFQTHVVTNTQFLRYRSTHQMPSASPSQHPEAVRTSMVRGLLHGLSGHVSSLLQG